MVSHRHCELLTLGGNLLSLIPSNNIGNSDLVEASEEGEGGEYDRRNHPLPLVEDLENGSLLEMVVSARHAKLDERESERDKNPAYLFWCLALLVVHCGLTLAWNSCERNLAASQPLTDISARGYRRLLIGSHDRYRRQSVVESVCIE